MHSPIERRRRPSVATAVSFLALFVALSGSGAAATFESFVLGKTNLSTRPTGLAAATLGPVLAVTNTGTGVAGSFTVKAGAQPFTVNSAVRVKNLNADLLDGSSGTSFWNTSGNAGTSAARNFIGTTDGQPLVIKTNGKEAARVDTAGNVGIGTTSPAAPLTVVGTSGDTILGSTNGGTAIHGQSNTGKGVSGTSDSGTAVSGDSSTGIAVYGHSTTEGVVGQIGSDICRTGSFGVIGCGSNGGTGVLGAGGVAGVRGEGGTEGVTGVLGVSDCSGRAAIIGCPGPFGDAVVGVIPHDATGYTTFHAENNAGGNLFVGDVTGKTKARIDGSGKGFFDGGTQVGGADYADSMRAVAGRALRPGDVLAIDPARGNTVELSRAPHSTLVAGVYSTRPSVLGVGNHHIGASLDGDVPVALVGVVPTHVSAENGPVRAGDLLTSSSTPGYAMKATPVVVGGVAVYPAGTIIGKALGSVHAGKGTINVLVTLR